jgi:hypothetical protein
LRCSICWVHSGLEGVSREPNRPSLRATLSTYTDACLVSLRVRRPNRSASNVRSIALTSAGVASAPALAVMSK